MYAQITQSCHQLTSAGELLVHRSSGGNQPPAVLRQRVRKITISLAAPCTGYDSDTGPANEASTVWPTLRSLNFPATFLPCSILKMEVSAVTRADALST